MNGRQREVYEIDEFTIKGNIGDINDKKVQCSFATRFNLLLSEKGFSQKHFSEKSGIASSSLSDYRNGKAEPKITAVAKIASVLGVSVDYLLGISDIKSLEVEVQNACTYTHLSEKALILLHKYPDNEERKLELKILSHLIESGQITEISNLLGSALIASYQFDFIYNRSDEESIKDRILETSKLDFHKNVLLLYEDAYEELYEKYKNDIQNIVASRIADIQEIAETTKEKMEIILANLSSAKLEDKKQYVKELIMQYEADKGKR